MPTAEELVIAVRNEGIGETRDQLEGVEDSMEETAESAGESAEQLEGFSERFAGAMTAAVSALALGAAGLLAQVPVLGEAFGGLAAIVQGLAFQMDKTLRPVLSPLTNLFYQIAGAIFNAEGAFGTIIGVVSTLASLAAVLIPAIAAVGAQLGVWASTGAGVISILGTIAGAIGTVISAIAGLPVALTAAVAAIVAFAAAYLTNWRGTRDVTNKIVGEIIDFVVGGFKNLTKSALQWTKDLVNDVVSWFTDLADTLASWAGDLASKAFQWGTDIIQAILSGFENAGKALTQALESVINSAIEAINSILDTLPDSVTSMVGIESFEKVDIGGVSTTRAENTASQRSGSGRRFSSVGGSGSGIQMDGRQLSESTGRYRTDPSRRRGL